MLRIDVAIGMTAVIITGGIDLSVGSILCLSAMVTGVVLHAGSSVWIGIAAGLAASLLLWSHGRVAGISGILGGLFREPHAGGGYRISFLLGLVATGVVVLSNQAKCAVPRIATQIIAGLNGADLQDLPPADTDE